MVLCKEDSRRDNDGEALGDDALDELSLLLTTSHVEKGCNKVSIRPEKMDQ